MSQVAKSIGGNWFAIGLSIFLGGILIFNVILVERLIFRVWWPFIEETAKFLPVILVFFLLNKKFSPYLLGFFVALGFSLTESFLFVLFNGHSPIGRVPAVFLHLFATTLSSSTIVKLERDGWHKAWWVIPSFLLLASLLHLGFNLVILSLNK